jgi:hypothetical protein
MMVATLAFTLQGAFILASETVSGENSRYHHGFAHDHAYHGAATRLVTHVHRDGTVHQHVIDDDDEANHIQQPGCPCCWNMAIAIGVLPIVTGYAVTPVASKKLAIALPDPYRGTEPTGPRRPPRPPSIA